MAVALSVGLFVQFLVQPDLLGDMCAIVSGRSVLRYQERDILLEISNNGKKQHLKQLLVLYCCVMTQTKMVII